MDKEKTLERRTDRRELIPPVDIFDEGDKVVLLADMPGVKAGDLDVRLERGTLTIHGRRGERPSGGEWVLEEFLVGDYHRVFTVGEDVDPAKVTAELKDGVLKLSLGKVEERKPRKIQITTG